MFFPFFVDKLFMSSTPFQMRIFAALPTSTGKYLIKPCCIPQAPAVGEYDGPLCPDFLKVEVLQAKLVFGMDDEPACPYH